MSALEFVCPDNADIPKKGSATITAMNDRVTSQVVSSFSAGGG